jgi:hypothetical protein
LEFAFVKLWLRDAIIPAGFGSRADALIRR